MDQNSWVGYLQLRTIKIYNTLYAPYPVSFYLRFYLKSIIIKSYSFEDSEVRHFLVLHKQLRGAWRHLSTMLEFEQNKLVAKKPIGWDSCTGIPEEVGNQHWLHYVQHSQKLSEYKKCYLELQDSPHKDYLYSLERTFTNLE